VIVILRSVSPGLPMVKDIDEKRHVFTLAGVPGGVAQFLLDADELVVLRRAVRTRQ
jgi:hypothetical protein